VCWSEVSSSLLFCFEDLFIFPLVLPPAHYGKFVPTGSIPGKFDARSLFVFRYLSSSDNQSLALVPVSVDFFFLRLLAFASSPIESFPPYSSWSIPPSSTPSWFNISPRSPFLSVSSQRQTPLPFWASPSAIELHLLKLGVSLSFFFAAFFFGMHLRLSSFPRERMLEAPLSGLFRLVTCRSRRQDVSVISMWQPPLVIFLPFKLLFRRFTLQGPQPAHNMIDLPSSLSLFVFRNLCECGDF